jgi:hypothetical protein
MMGRRICVGEGRRNAQTCVSTLVHLSNLQCFIRVPIFNVDILKSRRDEMWEKCQAVMSFRHRVPVHRPGIANFLCFSTYCIGVLNGHGHMYFLDCHVYLRGVLGPCLGS